MATRCQNRLRDRFLNANPVYSWLQLCRFVHLRDITRFYLHRHTTTSLLDVADEQKRTVGVPRRPSTHA